MNQEYTDCVEQVSSILFNAIIEREKNLTEKIPQLDRDLFSLLRRIGLRVMSMILSCLINQVTNKEKKPDFIIHRRPKIKYTVLFGKLKIESPYLWNKKLKKGVRPVASPRAHHDQFVGSGSQAWRQLGGNIGIGRAQNG